MARFTLVDNSATPESSGTSAPKGKYRLVTPDEEQSYLAGLARTGLGQGMLLGFGDEIVAGLRAMGTDTYDQALADERANVKKFEEEHPIASTAAELAGSVATPGVGLVLGSLKPAETLIGKVSQGAKIGAGFGATAGFGSAEGGFANRLEGAKEGGLTGAALGAVLPAGAAAAHSVGQAAADVVRPGIARMTKGVEDAADVVMAQRLRDSGQTVPELRTQLANAEDAARFHSNSEAQVPMGLVDTSNSFQKLAGSASRSSSEAGDRASAFFEARQTGKPAQNAAAQRFVDEAGLPTKNPMAPVGTKDEPTGQYERIRDALNRSLLIEDKDFHGLKDNAYRTEKAMMATLKSKAQSMFPDAYQNANAFDLGPAFTNLDAVMADRAGNHQAVLARARKLFLDPKSPNGAPLGSPDQLKRFQSAKEMLDDTIETAMRAGKSKLAGDLTQFRRDLTQAAKSSNPKYADALDYYSSQMELKDAIDAGRKAFSANPDVSIDDFKSLTEGQKKLFRLGVIESFERNLGRSPRVSDRTNAFENPNTQALLREIIPRPLTPTGRVKKNAVFADRPERFGQFIDNEKRMVKSRDKVLGNSITTERLQDDSKFTRQSLSQMVDRLRMSGGLTGVVFEGAAAGLNRIFGLREDVATEVARRLFTVRPDERERILTRLEAIGGPQKAQAFETLLGRLSLVGTATLTNQAGAALAPTVP